MNFLEKKAVKLEMELRRKDKVLAIELIEEAAKDGCRKAVACSDLGIDQKTFLRWKDSIEDKRKVCCK